MSKKSGKAGSFIGGFITGIGSIIGGYFVYKLVKPDYLKDYDPYVPDDDYEPDDDLDDFEDIKDLDD